MLKQNRTKEPGGELRNQFGATLKELMEQNEKIIVLDSDLAAPRFSSASNRPAQTAL